MVLAMENTNSTATDYYTNVDDHGMDLAEAIPMTCNDCGRPALYDYNDEQYHHALNAAVGCFLIPSEDRQADMRHPLLKA